ncbi:MAG: hypothetical protein OSB58_19420, partial [Alphaproteobacteria bacterium]|nr:hypothetical protein [Alphaproteobacteria bacterium]
MAGRALMLVTSRCCKGSATKIHPKFFHIFDRIVALDVCKATFGGGNELFDCLCHGLAPSAKIVLNLCYISVFKGLMVGALPLPL